MDSVVVRDGRLTVFTDGDVYDNKMEKFLEVRRGGSNEWIIRYTENKKSVTVDMRVLVYTAFNPIVNTRCNLMYVNESLNLESLHRLDNIQMVDRNRIKYPPPEGEWTTVPSFEGRYYSNGVGEIYSCLTGEILQATLLPRPCELRENTYTTIGLTDTAGKRYTVNSHTIIALTFLGTIPKGYVVDHINRVKWHNSVDNLRIVTPKVNRANTGPRSKHGKNTDEVLDTNFIDIGKTYIDIVGTPRDFTGNKSNGFGQIISRRSYEAQLRQGREIKLLKPAIHFGYSSVELIDLNTGETCRVNVHRIVASLFVPNPDPDSFRIVNHLDHNRSSNHYTNLQWCDAKENSVHGKGVAVDQLDPVTTQVIKTFRSASEASEEIHSLGFKNRRGTISNAWTIKILIYCSCRSNRQACGFLWRYSE